MDDIIADMVGLVHEAHALGRTTAATEMKARMAAIFGDDVWPAPTVGGIVEAKPNAPPSPKATRQNAEDDSGSERAPMGTVKPAIVRLINDTPSGLTQDEIIEKTGFKSNSVRGTLYTILTEELVERKSGRYFPITKNSEGSGASASEPSQN